MSSFQDIHGAEVESILIKKVGSYFKKLKKEGYTPKEALNFFFNNVSDSDHSLMIKFIYGELNGGPSFTLEQIVEINSIISVNK